MIEGVVNMNMWMKTKKEGFNRMLQWEDYATLPSSTVDTGQWLRATDSYENITWGYNLIADVEYSLANRNNLIRGLGALVATDYYYQFLGSTAVDTYFSSMNGDHFARPNTISISSFTAANVFNIGAATMFLESLEGDDIQDAPNEIGKIPFF
jgi:hypothetical protein